MKLRVFLFALLLSSCYCNSLLAQCPATSITFSTQGQIDSFQMNYPGCTNIPEDVMIKGDGITNLNGLLGIDSVGGDLIIGSTILNQSPDMLLADLIGLDSLSFVGGDLRIVNIETLVSLEGLDQLYSIGGSLGITRNGLTSLNGLEQLSFVGADLTIGGNAALTDISSLNKITSVPGKLSIGYAGSWGPLPFSAGNPILPNLAGLENITSAGALEIRYNDSLSSLDGLKNLIEVEADAAIGALPGLASLSGLEGLSVIGGTLTVSGIPMLTALNELNQLDSLGGLHLSYNDALISLPRFEKIQVIPGPVTIYNNDALTSIDELSQLTATGGLNISYNSNLISLNGLRNFTSINGNVNVEANDLITSLAGMERIDSVKGSLTLAFNEALSSLDALNNLSFIGAQPVTDGVGHYRDLWGLTIRDNPVLTSLSGLDQVSTIEGSLRVLNNDQLVSITGLGALRSIGGHCTISYNDSLISLNGLESLDSIGSYRDINWNLLGMQIASNSKITSMAGLNGLDYIEGDVSISDNLSLTTLSGLEDLKSIGGKLFITNNDNLSFCAIRPVCDHLQSGGYTTILNNALGCRSGTEVREACLATPTKEISGQEPEKLKIVPNPVADYLIIQLQGSATYPLNIQVFDAQGKMLYSQMLAAGQSMDTSALLPGLYSLKGSNGEQVYIGQFIKL